MKRRPGIRFIPELNMQKVVAAVRKPTVGLYSEDGINLVTNTHLMLVLTDDELWHIQASLRLREIGMMYQAGSTVPYRPFPEQARKMIAEVINAKNIPLEVTGLSDGNNNAYLARDGGFVIVQKSFFDAFNEIKTVEQSADNPNGIILVNGKHLIMPLRGTVSKYLTLPHRARLEAV